MDFTGRGSQPAQPASTGTQYSGGAAAANNKKSPKGGKKIKWGRLGTGLLGLLVLVLVVSVIVVIAFGKKSEADYVDTTKLQAVFLETGQVYFGKVDPDTMTNKSFVLNNIYYLQTSNSGATNDQAAAANTNVSLVKLGCELHAPFDKMIINRDQVTFWENLQDNGQVAKAVATFEKDNPEGQKCADQSAAPNSQTNVQGSSNTNNNGGTNTTTPSNNN